MQRILVLKQPYGTAFMFAANATEVWLMYDDKQEETVLDWLRNILRSHEDKLTAEAAGALGLNETVEIPSEVSTRNSDEPEDNSITDDVLKLGAQ